MGSFDCYCAICGATLDNANIEVGSTSPKFLARRRARVERQKRARELGEELASPDDDDEFEEEGEGRDYWNTADDDHAYDPELLGDTTWLSNVRCLGFNPAAMGNGRAFISGPAKYEDYGRAKVSPGSDPNQPSNETSFPCFWAMEGDVPVVFPFHECCFDIVSRALTGSENRCKIDKDALYNIMIGLSEQFENTLAISHGDINGGQQFWERIPGEEYTVTQPVFSPVVKAFIQRKIASNDLAVRRQFVLEDEQQRISDPFHVLSNELVWQIARYLPAEAILALSTASWPVFNATRDNGFWKAFIYNDMPWAATELQHIINDTQSQELDYKALYLWFEWMTVPQYGVGTPWMGLANRRRIWGACQELADLYRR
ncbi:hypothetical protein TrVFT333_002462 [Trichoderma virens FT-333]|nr:hypothetical protein TrVFT333_002462 [Trichoderma virens FT-333]